MLNALLVKRHGNLLNYKMHFNKIESHSILNIFLSCLNYILFCLLNLKFDTAIFNKIIT
jgi:hypothetical protein